MNLESITALHLTSFHLWPKAPVDVLFVHGNVDLQEGLLDLAAQYFHERKTNSLAINGMTQAECLAEKINHVGVEKALERLKGIPREKIHLLKPARHTKEEATALLSLAQTQSWKKLGFLTLPYHTLRSALTHLAAQKQLGYRVEIHPLNLPGVIWNETITKQILGQELKQFQRLQMISEEFSRIERYQSQGDCVSYAELIQFFSKSPA